MPVLGRRRDAILKTTELAKQAVQNGITPLRLCYYAVKPFQGEDLLLRSILKLESLDLGVLSPQQYRFVARRTKQGDALVDRHLNKLFAVLPGLLARNKTVQCVSIPAFPRALLQGTLAQLLFSAMAKYPDVDPKRVCLEFSSDILFEDFETVQKQFAELRQMGVKLAISEVGDDFCPLTRLITLAPDYVFADCVPLSQLPQEQSAPSQLAKFLHLAQIQVYLPLLDAPWQEQAGQAAGFDGYLLALADQEVG